MSDKKTVIGDKMIEAQLEEKSNILNISLVELIDRYIRREYYVDEFYVPPKLTREELMEMSRRDVERDKKWGFPPKKHNFDAFIGRWNRFDD